MLLRICLILCLVHALHSKGHSKGRYRGPMDASLYDKNECLVSRNKPRKPLGLEFCHWYNQEACCLPAMDAEIHEFFEATMNLGVACSPAKEAIKRKYQHVLQWVCMSCDPKEPDYRCAAAAPISKLRDQCVLLPFFFWFRLIICNLRSGWCSKTVETLRLERVLWPCC